MVALHVVLVDTVVLQVDKDAVDETYPEGAGCQVIGKGSQRELVAHGTVSCKFERLHGTLGHGEHQNGQAQQCATNEDNALYGIRPDDGLQTTHHGIDDDAYRREDNDGVHIPPHEDIHRHGQQIEDRTHAGYLRQQIAG